MSDSTSAWDEYPFIPGLPDIVGTGSSENGFISITIGRDGFVHDVKLDPRAMRLGSHELAEHARSAMLAAQRDWLDRSSSILSAAMKVGTEKLGQRLTEVREEYQRQMAVTDSARDDLLRRLGDGR